MNTVKIGSMWKIGSLWIMPYHRLGGVMEPKSREVTATVLDDSKIEGERFRGYPACELKWERTSWTGKREVDNAIAWFDPETRNGFCPKAEQGLMYGFGSTLEKSILNLTSGLLTKDDTVDSDIPGIVLDFLFGNFIVSPNMEEVIREIMKTDRDLMAKVAHLADEVREEFNELVEQMARLNHNLTHLVGKLARTTS